MLQGHVHFQETIYAKGTCFLSGGAICANWWKGDLHGVEEGFLLVKIKGNEFDWEYIDYKWEVEK